MEIKRVGIVGCGTMGAGIAQLVLQAGYGASVMEVEQGLLDKGVARIKGGFQRLVEKGALAGDKAAGSLAGLSGSTSLADLGTCDLIIEAAFENFDVKMDIFSSLDGLCNKETIFASNTSSLPISKMATRTGRKERFIGLHFFNPVAVMPLVEVVKTIATDGGVLEQATQFVKSLGKTPITAKDNAGFIVNLFLTPYLLDAIRGLGEGVASTQDIDAGMKLGCNHPMGPLMLADFIGLDVLCNAANILFEEYREKRYAPPPLLTRMVTMGYIGAKAGRGFYDWSNPKSPVPADL